ncbi:hypothetical protein Tco_1559330 [Tanacetum coccineum]
MPLPFINPEEDERVEETLTDPKHGEFTIKVLPPHVQKAKPPSQRNFVIHQRDPRYPHIPYPSRMNQEKWQEKDESLLSNKEKLIELANTPLNENCSTVILKKLPEKLEMILRDGNERLILNMRHDTSSYSSKPHQESINMIDVYNVSHEEILKDLFATNHQSGNPTSSSHPYLTSLEVNDDIFDPEEDIIKNFLNLDKTKDLPPYHDNPLSGNPTPIWEP